MTTSGIVETQSAAGRFFVSHPADIYNMVGVDSVHQDFLEKAGFLVTDIVKIIHRPSWESVNRLEIEKI